jgi:protein-disulfide isomerase
MHDLMFETQNALKEEDLKAKAAQLKLDAATFNDCLSSGKYAARVKQEQREGFSLGVATTPSFFINGRFFTGAIPEADVSKTIDEEILLSASRAESAAAQAAGNGISPSSAKTP